MDRNVDVLIIGAGPAGLAAGIAARENGAQSVLIIEREDAPGGILNQCIHDGFGLVLLGEMLTGPEYAHHFIEAANMSGVEILCNAFVISLTDKKQASVVYEGGIININAKAVVLCMGCRERTRGAISIPGSRPAGIFSAGVAQQLVNIKNIMPGREVVILGTGDIGLIMARRLTLEGARVSCVIEKLHYPNGLQRNIAQCLNSFGIPLKLSHTIVDIEGYPRIKSVTIAQLDIIGKPIPGSRKKIPCDTLILSVGLIPENELSKEAGVNLDGVTGGGEVDEMYMTSIDGIFACGNVLQVHDLVDNVSIESGEAGKNAALYAENPWSGEHRARVIPDEGIRYVVPKYISKSRDVVFSMRVNSPALGRIVLMSEERVLFSTDEMSFAPSSMTRLRIPKDMLNVPGDKLSFKVVESGGI